MIKLCKLKPISLRKHPRVNEGVVQQYIAKHPEVLGLGSDLSVCEEERRQPSGGVLDLLLKDKGNKRYEVEIQLGPTDPSHIIRTIEYWDVESKQDPYCDHCAVIVAEEITGRFFNVIGLFNGQIPLIAINLTAIEYPSGEVGLLFTRVLDELKQPSSHETWEKEHGPEWVKFAEKLFQSMRPDSAEEEPDYTNSYIAMRKGKKHVLWLKYQKNAVHVELACPAPNPGLKKQLQDAGVEPKYYENVRYSQYWFNVPITTDLSQSKLPAVVRRFLGGNDRGE